MAPSEGSWPRNFQGLQFSDEPVIPGPSAIDIVSVAIARVSMYLSCVAQIYHVYGTSNG